MAEKEIIADNLRIDYTGVVSPEDFLKFLDTWNRANGYSKVELKNSERLTENSRNVEFKFRLVKRMTDYIVNQINLRIKFKGLQETLVHRQDKPIPLMSGNIEIVLDGVLVTDLEHRWEMKPEVAFTREVLQKFLLGNFLDKYRNDIAGDAAKLLTQLKSFLNLYRYEY